MAVLALQLGVVGESLNEGILVLARNVIGFAGLGLACSLVTGGLLAWVLPLGYMAFCQYALIEAWSAPWTWSARPPAGFRGTLRPSFLGRLGVGALVALSTVTWARVVCDGGANPGYKNYAPACSPGGPAQSALALNRRAGERYLVGPEGRNCWWAILGLNQ
jgi:hypothetical protein